MARTAAIALVLALGWATAAEARTFTVTERDDPKPGNCTKRHCSLREAIIAANDAAGPDTVELPGRRPYNLSLKSTGEDESLDGDLDITSPLVVLHRSFGARPAIDANGIDRVFDVHAAATIRNVTIRGGSAHPVDGDGDGGGVLTDSELGLKGTRIVDNETTVVDGNGGAVDNDAQAKVQIRNSLIEGNTALGEAGGVAGSLDGPTRIDQVVIRGNTGGEGGGVQAVGEVTITRSTIVDNHAVSGLDDELGDGGGVYVDDQGVLAVENSTITGNFALRSGGGVYGEPGAIADIKSATIARNRADSGDTGLGTGGGVQIDAATFEVVNSIIALNTATGGAGSDCGGGTYLGTAPNLISTAAGGCAPGSPIVAADPGLGELAGSGHASNGATPTIPLLPGSPALDAADPALSPPRDQRATLRDDGHPDLGAYEL